MVGEQLLWGIHFSSCYFLLILGYIVKVFFFKVYNLKYYQVLQNNSYTFMYIKLVTYGFIFFQCIFLSTFKVGYTLVRAAVLQIFNLLLLLLIFSYFLVSMLKVSEYKISNYQRIYLVLVLIFSTVVSFFFATDLIFFLLSLELVTITFYVFFLIHLENVAITLIKYKSLLANYLWGTFFVTFLFFLGLIFFVISCGSINFVQINELYLNIPIFAWGILLVSFMLKIGSGGFYFFKFEIYQFLSLMNLFFFSIITCYSYCFILHFFFSVMWCLHNKFGLSLLCIVLLVNVLVLIRSLYLINFYQFLGFSSVNLWSNILMLNMI